MNHNYAIRPGAPDDTAAIQALYPQAFPDEDLLPLVNELLDLEATVLSLVATDGDRVIGHIVFADCTIDPTGAPAALLGPLAVAPDSQRGGIGSALVHAGLDRMRKAGVAQILVLGDPAYYGRFGFAADPHVTPPYPMPPEYEGAWQSMRVDGVTEPIAGQLVVPPVWRQPALWGL